MRWTVDQIKARGVYLPVVIQQARPTGYGTNYDEDKIPLYTLPDPLVLHNGQPVKDAATWVNVSWPEILHDLQTYIYGHIPEDNHLQVAWNDAPVDLHELMALVAPRPLFINGGTTDFWEDPHGAFLAAVAAGPVYQLLGKNDLDATKMPDPDVALITGDIAFREHTGGHEQNSDWPAFLEFAQRYLHAPGQKPAAP